MAARAESEVFGTCIGHLRARAHDERGEVFPVAILFGGVLLTILIGVHVVLFSVGLSAVQSAADRGVAAVQTAPLGESSCGELGWPQIGGPVTPASERECRGMVTVMDAIDASGGIVRLSQLPSVAVDNDAGVVSVVSLGVVDSPVLGAIQVAGVACGPLDLVEGTRASRSDITAC